MRLSIHTAPAEEPVTLAEAKLWLRYEDSSDESLITALVKAARVQVENLSLRTLVSTTWTLRLDAWPSDGVIYLPRPPLVSVSLIQYVDGNGNTQTLDASAYAVSAGTPGRITAVPGASLPTVRTQNDAITIRYVAGFGAASAVPELFKTAVKLGVSHLFEHRGDSEKAIEFPPSIAALLETEGWGHYS